MSDDRDEPPGNSPGHPTYAIATVADFLAVPEDRIEDCLRDFAVVLHAARHTMAAIRATAEDRGHTLSEDAIVFPSFRWIDDGKRIARMEFVEREARP